MTVTGKPRKPPAKRYGKWLIGLALLIIGITPVALWRFRTRVPLLLDIATLVVPKERFYGEPFAWLSNEEYVCFGADGRTLSRYRLSSGVYSPILKPFDAKWEGFDVQASPNGEWLYWVKMTGPPPRSSTGPIIYNYNGPAYFHASITRLADTHTQKLESFDEGQWEPDSRHMINIGPRSEGANESALVIRDVLPYGLNRTVPFAPNVSSTRGNTLIVAPDRLLGFAIRDTFGKAFDAREPIKLIEYRLDKTLHSTHKWAVALPHHTTLGEAKIAPTGDRVAWGVDSVEVASGLAALHRLIPFLKAPSQPRQELWISQLDGTGMRIVGETPAKARNGNPLFVSDLRWLPDGKHLSFEYDGALWTVPAK